MTNIAMMLISAMILVESQGDNGAINGASWGPLQITADYVIDVNRLCGTSYKHSQVFDREIAIEIMTKYMSIYATKEKLGHEPTWENIARIHRKGPKGWCNPASYSYWLRVKKEMKKIKKE